MEQAGKAPFLIPVQMTGGHALRTPSINGMIGMLALRRAAHRFIVDRIVLLVAELEVKEDQVNLPGRDHQTAGATS